MVSTIAKKQPSYKRNFNWNIAHQSVAMTKFHSVVKPPGLFTHKFRAFSSYPSMGESSPKSDEARDWLLSLHSQCQLRLTILHLQYTQIVNNVSEIPTSPRRLELASLNPKLRHLSKAVGSKFSFIIKIQGNELIENFTWRQKSRSFDS